MRNKHSLLASAAIAAILCAPIAQADVVTINTGFGIVENFELFDGVVTHGPLLLSNGVTMTSSVYSTIGANAVDLVDNGVWGAGNRFAGIGDLSSIPSTSEGYLGSMTFDLGASVNGVGALFSIYNDGAVSGDLLIEALGAGNSVLEMFTFAVDLNDPFATNAGLFFGFSRASADIVALRVSGDGFVLDDLSMQPVPLPAALPLLLGGMALL
ncbi:MAG: hypothetical protein H7Z14_18090, partial [Anaerolineae bacterium]|nr:hypothetical protein [Phycisphaerae bacterium]